MRQALAGHDDLLRACIESYGGRVFKTMGDAFCAAFPEPRGAVQTVLASQWWLPALGLKTPAGMLPLRVRMALHTGSAEERDGDFFGPQLNRVARLLAIAHGGQVVLSGAAHEALAESLPDGTFLQDRGSHRLRDLSEPERVFQLCHPDLPAEFPPLRSLSTHPNNLPQQVTSFIGREREIVELKAWLDRTRALTLTGSGGCGKTRLALEVAADALERFPDGAWFVELAALADPDLVAQTVAGEMGLKEEPGRPILQTLIDYLRSRHLLLILDNCEHLLDATARLVDAILRACPRVLVLSSSREGLGIAGETAYRVPSLGLPEPGRETPPAALLQYEAVRLFLDRVELVSPGFQVTGENAPAIAAICRRLDGIPLAIELAAARVRALPVEEVNRRLDQRFRLLTGGSRTALPRQQTLRSLIDWSYELLTPAERALLCRLSVFSGGWTLEAAEGVCAGGQPEDGAVVERWEVLDLLTSLADKSLVVAETSDSGMRYRLLETVRQYARDRMLEGGQGESWRNAHLAFFRNLAESAEPHLVGPEQREWLLRLDAELDNQRAALAWASESSLAAEGLRLAGALWRFWEVRGLFGEAREWLSGLLAGGGEPAPRAKALNGAGVLACRQGDYAAARALHEESLSIRRELGDRWGVAGSLNNLGLVACEQCDFGTARTLHAESLAIMRELENRGGIAAVLNNLGNALHWLGDPGAARSHYEESLAIMRELGDRRGVALALDNLGNLAHERGDHVLARMLHAESLTLRWDVGDRRSTAEAMEGLATDVHSLGDPELAARLLGAAARLREEIGAPLPPSAQPGHEAQLTGLRAALGAEVFDRAWSQSHAASVDEAIRLALEPSTGNA